MAMQNLRDKLLKAGLVDKKQKSQVDTQDRREKKQRGAAELAAEEAEKRRQFEEKLAAEAEAQRQADAARAAERDQHERGQRVRSICDRWAVRQSRPGTQRFYFSQRSGRIDHLLLSEAICEQLRVGALAVIERVPVAPDAASTTVIAGRVEKPQARTSGRSLLPALMQKKSGAAPPGQASDAYVLVPPEAAERIAAIDDGAVRFWARSGQPLGVLSESEPVATLAAAAPPAMTTKP